jgi:hypothetical protein
VLSNIIFDFSQLIFPEEKSLDQDNNPNPNQDECANHHARDIGRPDELDSDCDTAEKYQADDTAQDYFTKDQCLVD